MLSILDMLYEKDALVSNGQFTHWGQNCLTKLLIFNKVYVDSVKWVLN